jgi:hypothetical protein
MVKIQDTSSEYEQLEQLLDRICESHGLTLRVEGWTRKTFDIFSEERKSNRCDHWVRVESMVTTTGEVRVYAENGMSVADEIAKMIESEFGVSEAIIIKESRQ